MKRVEELGISPFPWTLWYCSSSHCRIVNFGTEREIVMSGNVVEIASFTLRKNRETNLADARLTATAPKLYEALREAVIEWCHDCDHCAGANCYKCNADNGECFVQKWRSVLAEAAGEEVSK